MCASGEIRTLSVQRLKGRAVFNCTGCVHQVKAALALSKGWKEERFFGCIICVRQLKSVFPLSEDWKEEQFLATSCVSAEINTCSVQRLERKAVFNHIMCASGQISTLSEDWKEEQQRQSEVW